jgi:hypothetical protein
MTIIDEVKPDAFSLVGLVRTVGLQNALLFLVLAVLTKEYWSGVC